MTARLRQLARRSVERKDTAYYDAFANCGQIPGNVPDGAAVKIVAEFIGQGCECKRAGTLLDTPCGVLDSRDCPFNKLWHN